MDMFSLVRPEHLNHYGSLFGGQLLSWVDEFAYLVAVREFPGARLLTRAMAEVSFTRSVINGAMLRFDIQRARVGRTSVLYDVNVFAREPECVTEYLVFQTSITFVSVNKERRKHPLPEICSGN